MILDYVRMHIGHVYEVKYFIKNMKDEIWQSRPSNNLFNEYKYLTCLLSHDLYCPISYTESTFYPVLI